MSRVIVLHRAYGCDTGCCGHTVEIDGLEVGKFVFDHPRGTTREAVKVFAQRVVTEACGEDHVADIDWDNCLIVDD